MPGTNTQKITVTKPFLPPLDEFNEYLKQIWREKWVTNRGPFHEQFEQALCDFLDVQYISLFTNGTLALLTALQALRITGEVITTPYSFVATTHALHWNGIKPVFCDIEAETLTINPQKIEAAITPRTTAILAVHVYGNPCRASEIQKIADIYGLRVIYDAAHAFAVRQNGRSVLNFGDLSVLSFHGTKVFNTFEGGAIVSHDAVTKQRIDYLKNFGFADEVTVVGPGINGKMNEFQAALGLLQLKYIDEVIAKRRRIATYYRKALAGITGLHCLAEMPDVQANYSYFPIFIDNKAFGKSRDAVYQTLKARNIWGRRYFYPLITEFPTYRGLPSAKSENLPLAFRASQSVICLPIYPELEITEAQRVVQALENLSLQKQTTISFPEAKEAVLYE